VPTFLLPGNPVSALVLFEVLVRPLIRTTLGRNDPQRRRITARLLSPVNSIAGRRGYLRGRLLREVATGEYLVQPLGTSGTQLLTALAEANCLIELPEEVTEVTVNEHVTVAFLAPRG
jgi:molybdopterin molybdotransferase